MPVLFFAKLPTIFGARHKDVCHLLKTFVGTLFLCSDSVLKGPDGLSSQINGQVCILLQQLRLRKVRSVTLEDDG